MKYYTSPLDKAIDIDQALSSPTPIDYERWQGFCLSRFGLVTDSLRREIWPLMLGVCPGSRPVEERRSHCRFDSQIQVDIVRSLYNFDILKGQATSTRAVQADQLTHLMARVLSDDSELHYFQGFHDICTVFLLVNGEHAAYQLLQRFVHTHCYAFMKKTFAEVAELLSLSMRIVRAEDRKLCEKVEALQEDVSFTQMPMFALSWVLTFFSHVIPCFTHAARVFDFCLAHPLAVLYLVASVILHEKPTVMGMKDLPDLHRHFSRIVRTIDWEEICGLAAVLMTSQPPKRLLHPVPWSHQVLHKARSIGSFLVTSLALRYSGLLLQATALFVGLGTALAAETVCVVDFHGTDFH